MILTLMKLNDIVQLMDLNVTGYIAEIIAELILLKTFDKSLNDLTFSKPISVEMFLKKLLGTDYYQKEHSSIDNQILEGLVCFNHFIKRFDSITHDEVFKNFIGRGAAGKFKNEITTAIYLYR